MERIYIFLILTILTFVNIIVPITGSATVTPLLALIVPPHDAIGLATFMFMLGGIIRVVVFWKDIQFKYLIELLPVSLVGAGIGALALFEVNTTILSYIILAFLTYFAYYKALDIFGYSKNSDKKKTKNSISVYLIGLFTGFLQGFGLAGSDTRNGYLYSEGLTVTQVHGTTSFVGASNFLLATVIRLAMHKINIVDLSPLIALFPFMIIATVLGKKVLYKLNKEYADYLVMIVLLTMIVITCLRFFNIRF